VKIVDPLAAHAGCQRLSTNDFGAFYESAIDANGIFDRQGRSIVPREHLYPRRGRTGASTTVTDMSIRRQPLDVHCLLTLIFRAGVASVDRSGDPSAADPISTRRREVRHAGIICWTG